MQELKVNESKRDSMCYKIYVDGYWILLMEHSIDFIVC